MLKPILVRTGALLAALAFLTSGCASSASMPPVPASSPLAQVDTGMGRSEVVHILGDCTDEETYDTGKRWIPYYYGSDHTRTTLFFAGVGRVVVNSKGRVVRVEHDPQEDGFRD